MGKVIKFPTVKYTPPKKSETACLYCGDPVFSTAGHPHTLCVDCEKEQAAPAQVSYELPFNCRIVS